MQTAFKFSVSFTSAENIYTRKLFNPTHSGIDVVLSQCPTLQNAFEDQLMKAGSMDIGIFQNVTF